jgi:flagellar FliL protein
MSTAAAEPADEGGEAPKPAKPGRKKLLVLIAAAAVLLAAAGGGAAWWIKQKRASEEAAASAEGDGEATEGAAPVQREVRKTPPAFLPLDPFVVNLADRESDRYAQVGITLELDEASFADQLKIYMPAIRNGILMVLADKSSKELLSRDGKQRLAAEIMRAAVRPLGIELESEEEDPQATPGVPRTPLDQSPVRHVHFSTFIVQ